MDVASALVGQAAVKRERRRERRAEQLQEQAIINERAVIREGGREP